MHEPYLPQVPFRMYRRCTAQQRGGRERALHPSMSVGSKKGKGEGVGRRNRLRLLRFRDAEGSEGLRSGGWCRLRRRATPICALRLGWAEAGTQAHSEALLPLATEHSSCEGCYHTPPEVC